MTPAGNLLFLTADWVIPVGSPPQKNAVVVVKNDRIEEILSQPQWQSKYPHSDVCNYGQAVILPGLINLHTHLDYTKMSGLDCIGGLFAWVKRLMTATSQWSPEQWQESATAGAAAVALSGTSCVADSSYTGVATASALAERGLRAVVGLELFGLDNNQVESSWSRWLAKLAGIYQSATPALLEALEQGRIQLAIAPHAPYTVCPQLWSKAVNWAEANSRLIFCHLAESAAEVSFIAGDKGETDEFLADLAEKKLVSGLDELDWNKQKRSPVEHLEHYKLLNDKTLAAHGVHIQPNDLPVLARHHVKLAHCPRSNMALGNGVASLGEWLKNSITWGFGTDSLASNSDLNLLEEARCSWQLQKDQGADFPYSFEQAVYALTLGAAKALHLDAAIGSLEPGKYADIAVIKTTPQSSANSDQPYDLLLYGQTQVIDLFVSGRLVVKAGKLHGDLLEGRLPAGM